MKILKDGGNRMAGPILGSGARPVQGSVASGPRPIFQNLLPSILIMFSSEINPRNIYSFKYYDWYIYVYIYISNCMH